MLLSTPTTASALSAGRTTLIHLDHMNDHRGYAKLLSTWSRQLKLGGVLFLSLHCSPRPRHIFCVLDSPNTLASTGEFLTRLRTQNVDVNMRGQPCKERMSHVVAEFPGAPMQPEPTFEVVETEGAASSQSHMPFVRHYLRERRPDDAEAIIDAMDRYLDETTKPGKRR